MSKKSTSKNKNGILKLKDDHNITDKDFVKPKKIHFEGRNPKQIETFKKFDLNTINIILGSAGTGKSFMAMVYALLAVDCKLYSNIILLRPNSSPLGFLKGGLDDKIKPSIAPMQRIAEELIGTSAYTAMVDNQIIQPYALEYTEGFTYKNSVVVVDEVQNASIEHLRMIMTRIDDSSKLIILGDKSQIKLKDKSQSCVNFLEYFKDSHNINYVEFNSNEIVRAEITKAVEQIFETKERPFSNIPIDEIMSYLSCVNYNQYGNIELVYDICDATLERTLFAVTKYKESDKVHFIFHIADLDKNLNRASHTDLISLLASKIPVSNLHIDDTKIREEVYKKEWLYPYLNSGVKVDGVDPNSKDRVFLNTRDSNKNKTLVID